MKNTLTIHAGDKGDTSVGIWPCEIKITIEANCDMKDILENHINYEGNREKFIEDIKSICGWITDMPVGVSLEDQCNTCGEILEKEKSGYKKCNSKNHEFC